MLLCNTGSGQFLTELFGWGTCCKFFMLIQKLGRRKLCWQPSVYSCYTASTTFSVCKSSRVASITFREQQESMRMHCASLLAKWEWELMRVRTLWARLRPGQPRLGAVEIWKMTALSNYINIPVKCDESLLCDKSKCHQPSVVSFFFF